MGKTEKDLLKEIADHVSGHALVRIASSRESEKDRVKRRADFDTAISQLPHNVTMAYLLWILTIFGFGGLHRFYARRWLSGVGLLFLGLFTRSCFSSGGLGGIFFGLISGAFFTIWSFCDLFLIPHQVLEQYGELTVGGSEPSKHIPQPSRPPVPKVSLYDDLLGNRKPSARASSPAPRQKTLSQDIVRLARDRGSEGFTINDAVIALDFAPEKIGPELEKLMDQFLIEVYNDEEGRILYREPQSPTG